MLSFIPKCYSNVCRCLGFQLVCTHTQTHAHTGSHTLFMPVPVFVLCVGVRLCRVCRCKRLFAVACPCVCVCLGCRLQLWFSGNARGVGVTFSPSLSSICRARGQLSPGRLCRLPGAAPPVSSWAAEGVDTGDPRFTSQGDRGSDQCEASGGQGGGASLFERKIFRRRELLCFPPSCLFH